MPTSAHLIFTLNLTLVPVEPVTTNMLFRTIIQDMRKTFSRPWEDVILATSTDVLASSTDTYYNEE